MVITALLIIEKKMIAKREKKNPPQKLSNIRNRAGWLNHYRSQKFTKTTQRHGTVGYFYEVTTKV